jgi:hypothetical protein
MKQTIVRYQVKPECAAENARLIKNVFRELSEKALPDVRYTTLQSGDGWVTHFTMFDGEGVNPITTLPSFREYVSGVRNRVVDPPSQANDVTVVGNYGMLSG